MKRSSGERLPLSFRLRIGNATPPTAGQEEIVRVRAAVISAVVGMALLLVKIWAYRATRSTVVLSDALESTVNVIAAAFAVGGVVFAGRPADRSHPYGHGKIEFFTAAFEGGLISFAAVLILFEAAKSMIRGPDLGRLDLGLGLVVAAGIVNALLGLFLVRTGRRTSSLTLIADGKHVLSDFWTSLGAVVGLVLVRWTGVVWLDPLAAAVVGVNLAWTGLKLVRQAAGGLLDEEDPVLVRTLVEVLDQARNSGIIRVHNLRAIRAGRFHHVDAHLVVPMFWSVAEGHDAGDAFAARVIHELGMEGEILFHTDACHALYCRGCDLLECPVRGEPFVHRSSLTLEEAVGPGLDRFGVPMSWPSGTGSGVRQGRTV